MGQILDLSSMGTGANWFTEMDDYNRQEVIDWMLVETGIDLFERLIYRITFHMLDLPFVVVYEMARDDHGKPIWDGNKFVKTLEPQTHIVSGDWPECVLHMMKSEESYGGREKTTTKEPPVE